MQPTSRSYSLQTLFPAKVWPEHHVSLPAVADPWEKAHRLLLFTSPFAKSFFGWTQRADFAIWRTGVAGNLLKYPTALST